MPTLPVDFIITLVFAAQSKLFPAVFAPDA